MSNTTLDPTLTHQLLLAKTLYERACADLRARGPFAAGLAVSGLQDAIETCLLAVARRLDAATEKRGFREIWGDVDAAAERAGKQRLPRRTQMLAINETRVRFKHHGIMPDAAQADRFRSDAEAFLEEVTIECFGLSFSTLSEISLLSDETVRKLLTTAESELNAQHLTTALERCADAMAAIRGELEPLYQAPELVSFYGLESELQKALRAQNINLREKIVRVREVALGALLGLNVMELRVVEYLLPTKQGTEYKWRDSDIALLPKHVRRCIIMVTRYAAATQEYLTSAEHPDWDVS